MKQIAEPPEHAPRRRWLGVLARASRAELEAAKGLIEQRLGPVDMPRFLRRPEIGMAMVRGRAGGDGAAFNLGEMTVTRCTLQFSDGRLGCAYLAGRRLEESVLVALIDGLLQDRRHGAALADDVIEPLAEALAARRNQRLAKSQPTKVEFFTMVRGDGRP